MKSVHSILRVIVDWTGSIAAALLAIGSVVIWLLAGVVWFGFGTDYQLWLSSVTTIVTFIMVFLLQNSQLRDTTAIQAKLDELISATSGARNELVEIEKRESANGVERERKTPEEC